ncbi:Brother of Yb [Carabus blaptoides fortunei]
MACSKNKSIIHVETFYNPKLFWFVYDEDIANRNLFNVELNNSPVPYRRILEQPENQTIIAVKYGNNFVRAELVCANSLKKNYTCWLIDYGIFTDIVELYELPQKFKFQPAFAKKAMLYGLKPNTKYYDWANGGFVETATDQWQDGVNKEIKRILDQPKIILSFVKKCVFNDFVIGDIVISGPNLKDTCITDMIAGLGLADQDEIKFKADVFSSEQPDIPLRDVYMSIGQKGNRSLEMPSGRKSPIPLSGWLDLHDVITESSATEYVSCNSDIETARPHSLPDKTISVGRGQLRKYFMENSEKISVTKAPETCGVQASVSVSSAGRGYLKTKLNAFLNERRPDIPDDDIFQDAEMTSPDISADSANISKLPDATSSVLPYNKSAGRGFAKLFAKDKYVRPNIGFEHNVSSESNSDDDSQFQDARKSIGRGYTQAYNKESRIKAEQTAERVSLPFTERNVKCDVLKFKPAGAKLTHSAKSVTHHRSSSRSGNSSDSSTKYDSASSANSTRRLSSPSGKNFRPTMGPKRVPTDYSSDDSTAESNKLLNAPNCELSKVGPSESLVTGRCECTICKAWRSNLMVFKPHDLRERRPKQKKKIEKPPVLFKTSEHENDDIPGTVKSAEEFQNVMDKFTSPRLLVHGHLIPKPADNLEVLPFKSTVLKCMRRLNYVKSQRIQSYTWPAILRGNHVFVVSGPKSGKTMVYVPASCHFLLTKPSQYGQHAGPMGIVLCPGANIAWAVCKTMQNFLDGPHRNYVTMCVSPMLSNRKTADTVKNARILICTPNTFITILKEKLIKLTKLSHVVLESAKELFERFPAELETLFDVFQNVLMKRTNPVAMQMIVVSQEWSHAIENFAKRLSSTPLICIGSYVEAAFYGRTDIRVQFLESAAKSKKVVDILADNSKVYKTVIVCNELDEMQEMLKFLEIYGIDFLAVHKDSTMEDINEVNRNWSSAERGAYFVVVCTDDILSTSLYLVDASIVIHYSLPSSWTQFAFRFSTCIDNYKSPFITTNAPTCKVHIFVDESNSSQFVKMIQLLKRMGCNLTENILSLYEQYLNQLETAKINAGIELCKRIKMSGICRIGTNCTGRHMLSTELDLENRLPKSGIIKMKLLHVDAVTRLYGRVVEYIDAEHCVHALEDKYTEIAAEMLKLTDTKEQKRMLDVALGDICVVQETDGLFRRCKVIKITRHGTLNRPLNVAVKLIDTGAEILAPVSDLYLLPDHLKSIPPQAVEVYVANIGPADKDTTWSYHSRDRMLNELERAGYQDSNCYFTGRIKLQLNNTIWVDNLTLKEFLENGTLPVIKMSVRGLLLKLHLAEERCEHLLGLYDLCKKCGFNLPNYNLPVLNTAKSAVRQTKPVWAHLENCEEYNVVNLITIQSPDRFFIKLCKNQKSFNRLIEDIDSEMNKPFFPTICTVVEGQCYLAKDPEGDKYHRVLVTGIIDDQAECLFVDFGDYATVPVAELKFLTNEFIEQLPFQIIECKLWGIKPKNPRWSTRVTDFLYEFTIDPDSSLLRKLQVKIMGHDTPEVTGYKKYSVILINTLGSNSIVNKQIVDRGYALRTENLDVVDYEKLVKTEPLSEHSDDEQSTDENHSDDSEWEFQSADPAKFFRQIFGLPDVPDIVPQTTTKKQITSTPKREESAPLPAPGYSTPKVQWHQTDTHVTMKILLPDVTVYDIHVLRKRLLSFKTEYNHTTYRLDLNLYAKVESDITHEALGMYIQVKLTKQIAEEWERLVVSTERLRNITYNVAVLPNEYDPDDDQQLPREVFERAKKRGDDNQQGFVYEIGSDVDYSDSESDVFSARESSDS